MVPLKLIHQSSLILFALFPPFLLAQWHAAPRSGAGAVFDELTFTRLAGSGQDSINAMTADRDGNLYIAATTTSTNLPIKNAVQPQMGGAAILRSTDLGATWSKLGSPPIDPPYSIAASPASTQVLFVGGDKGIARSTDGGNTWNVVYALTPVSSRVTPIPPPVPSIAIDPGNPARVVACIKDLGLIVSSDYGEHWSIKTRFSQPSGSRVWVDPAGSGTIVVKDASFFRISRDFGNSWKDIQPPVPPFGFPHTIAFDPRHLGVMYLTTSAGVVGRVYRSSDWGATWVERSTPPTMFSAIDDLLVDSSSPDTLYAHMSDASVFKSSDAAGSWQKSPSVTSSSGGKFVALPPSCFGGRGLFLVTGDSAFATANSGETWAKTRLSQIQDVTATMDCSLYAARPIQPDAYIAKLNNSGDLLWSTFWEASTPK